MESGTYESIQGIDFSRLRPVDALVPTDSMFVPWHSSRSQSEGRCKDHLGREETLGDNVILNAYMQCAGIRSLHPSTLVPIGVLMLLYNTVFPPDSEGCGGNHPVAQQALQQGLIVREPDGLIPFAAVLGKDVIEYTLTNQ